MVFENNTIKKRLNYAMFLAILYFISALWFVWWQNIIGKSPLLFIGFIYVAFSVLKLSSRKKMIILDSIIFIFIWRLLLKYISRLFLIGVPYFFIFYFFSIGIVILHIFCLSHHRFRQYFVFTSQEIQKINEINQFRKIVPTKAILIFILFFLSSLAICSNKIIKIPTINNYLIPSKNIQFLLQDSSVVAKPSTNIPWQYVYFEEYDFEFRDNKNRLLSVFLTMDYDSKSGIIFGKSFETTVGKGCFRIGKGEVIKGQFRAIFPEGTRFVLLTDVPQFEFGVKDMMSITLPHSFEELKFDHLSELR